MFDWLFPDWSNPLHLTLLVGMRISVNAYLTAMVARVVGLRTLHTAVMGTVTLLSAVLMILLLRPSGPGLDASYVEFLLQVLLIAIAGYTAFSYPSSTRRIVTVVVLIGAISLLLITIPIYGEAFVAP